MHRVLLIVLTTSIAACNGANESARLYGEGGGAPNGGTAMGTGAASGAMNGAGTGEAPASNGSGGSPGSAGEGGAQGAVTGDSGGALTMAGGAATASGGSAGAMGGTSGASGTSGNGGGGAPASGGGKGNSGGYPNLVVAGNTTTLELAPVLLAAKSDYPGMARVTNGSIANLWTGADLATNAETQALVQSVTHANLRIVFTVCEGIYRIVARRSAGIAALGDLRGKRIATLPGTSSAYFLHAMLGTVQLGDSDVTVVSAVPNQIPNMLTSHQVDAATVWEPEIQNASDALAQDAIEFQDKSVYRELFDLHTTAEKLADPTARRGIVEFLRALIKASQDIVAQPSSEWPQVASTTGFDAALIAKSWKNEAFPGTLVPDVLDVLVQEELWLAKTGGRTARGRADLAKLIDQAPLAEAMMP